MRCSFLPAAAFALYGFFLSALVVLAAGITCLQVSANPYVANLGPEKTAASRLNFSQAFNSLGTTLAPKIGGLLILGGIAGSTQITPEKLHSLPAALAQTYRVAAGVPRCGCRISRSPLRCLPWHWRSACLSCRPWPRTRTPRTFVPGAFDEATGDRDSIWRHPWLLMGALSIFLYVGAEVSIGSFLVKYFGLPKIMGFSEVTAGRLRHVLLGAEP